MRRIGLIAGLLCAGVVVAWAAGSGNEHTTAVFTDEGDVWVPFSVQCASTSWTTLLSSDTISRGVLYYAAAENTNTICISTITTTAITCSSTTAGVELVPGAAFSDYTNIVVRCRAKQTVGSLDTRGYIKGRRSRDRGDYGNINVK